MDIFVKMLTVFGLSIIELWLAIPVGISLELHPLLIGITSVLGTSTAAIIVIFFGDKLRKWILSIKKNEVKKKEEYSKYGINMGLWDWDY